MEISIKKGEFVTLQGTATNDAGTAVDISSGYTFAATVKRNLSQTDAEALVHIDSATEASRFSAVTSTLTTYLLTSAESNAAESGYYYRYDIWAVETATGQEYPVDRGTITIKGAVTTAK